MTCAIKICGVTAKDDVYLLAKAGVDYLGVLVDVASSPRSVNLATARQIVSVSNIPTVILTFDHEIEQVREIVRTIHPFAIQLAGNETEDYVAILRKELSCELWKSLHIPLSSNQKLNPDTIAKEISNLVRVGVDRIVLDSAVAKGSKIQKGGTGKVFDWSLALAIRKRVDTFIFLAGGLNPANITEALLQVSPDGIDLSSGVESSIGKKDPRLVKELVRTVREIGQNHLPGFSPS